MDDTDLENFDKFVERHWSKTNKKTIEVSSEATETKPKRRGRKPKSETMA